MRQHKRPRSSNTLSKNFLIIASFVLAVFVFAGCAKETKKPGYKKIPQTGQKVPAKPGQPQEPAKPVEPPLMNAKPSTKDVVTPKRQASMRLVERGKTTLAAGNAEQAAATFRDAVNVDSSNGVAYYYLAEAAAEQKQNDVALGLLDKAEALLGADEEWMGKIDTLRSKLGGDPSKAVVTSPIDKSF